MSTKQLLVEHGELHKALHQLEVGIYYEAGGMAQQAIRDAVEALKKHVEYESGLIRQCTRALGKWDSFFIERFAIDHCAALEEMSRLEAVILAGGESGMIARLWAQASERLLRSMERQESELMPVLQQLLRHSEEELQESPQPEKAAAKISEWWVPALQPAATALGAA